jgi:hypothetical protein
MEQAKVQIRCRSSRRDESLVRAIPLRNIFVPEGQNRGKHFKLNYLLIETYLSSDVFWCSLSKAIYPELNPKKENPRQYQWQGSLCLIDYLEVKVKCY